MARGAKRYLVPEHLSLLGISQEKFGEWLDRITKEHVKGDRKRFKCSIRPELYRSAIYRAVCDGGDRDYYTGWPLDWRTLQRAGRLIGAPYNGFRDRLMVAMSVQCHL